MKKKRKSILGAAAKIAVLALIITGTASASGINAREGIALKGGFDFPGKLDIEQNSDDTTLDMDSGFSGAVEYAAGYNSYFSYGGGISGQYPHSVNDDIKGKLGFVEGYGMINFTLPAVINNTDLYTTLQLGWSYPYADSTFKDNFADSSFSGDVYWGAGVGVVLYSHYLVEFFYRAHHGEMEQGDDASEFEHRHFGLAIGYQF